MYEIWFWQSEVSQHMAGLASTLAKQGHKVTYIAEQEVSAARVKLGWQTPDMPGVQLRFVSDNSSINSMVQEASASSVHLCQGIRGNGILSLAQQALKRRGLCQWVVMETIDDAGVVGMIKRWKYGRLFRSKRSFLKGVLAIGHTTTDWIKARGMPAASVYSFAYFLPEADIREHIKLCEPGSFRFLFVGKFDNNKRLELLVNSLQVMLDRKFELIVVGSGPLEGKLRVSAESALPDRVRWLGKKTQADVPQIMAQADCLVLPSQHDGWGAVISEAMMAGTPVICSDTCGAAGVVQASGFGGVFSSKQNDELRAKLEEQLRLGPINTENRVRLASWATALGAEAGARYLSNILDYASNGGSRPMPPWQNGVS